MKNIATLEMSIHLLAIAVEYRRAKFKEHTIALLLEKIDEGLLSVDYDDVNDLYEKFKNYPKISRILSERRTRHSSTRKFYREIKASIGTPSAMTVYAITGLGLCVSGITQWVDSDSSSSQVNWAKTQVSIGISLFAIPVIRACLSMCEKPTQTGGQYE